MTQLTDSFLQRATLRLQQLATQRSELLHQMNLLQEKLRVTQEEGDKIASLLEGYAEFMGIEHQRPVSPKPRTRHLDLPRGAYANLVYQALVELGGSASLGQIVGHLRRNGLIPEAEHAYYSARSALNRQPGRIVKTRRGFQLRDLTDHDLREEVDLAS